MVFIMQNCVEINNRKLEKTDIKSLNLEELKEDYFRHAYGDLWKDAVAYLEAIDEHMPQTYIEAKHTIKLTGGQYYNPDMKEKFEAVKGITEAMEEKFKPFRNMPYRVQTVAVRLLMEHAIYCRGFAEALALKCVGKDADAQEKAMAFLDDFGSHELAMERYYDHMMAAHALKAIFNTRSEFSQ